MGSLLHLLPLPLVFAALVGAASAQAVEKGGELEFEVETVVGEALAEVVEEVVEEVEGVVVGVELADEVVIEAKAEKAPEGADAEEGAGDTAEAEPLPPGDVILRDLDFDPTEKDYAEKVGSLFLEADGLAEVRQQIEDLDAEDFLARNDASKGLAMVEAPVEHLLGAARKDAGIEMARRIQSILNVRVKQRRLDALYHVADKIAAEGSPGYVDRLLVMASTFDPSTHWDLLRTLEMAVAKSAREQDRERLEKGVSAASAATRELAAFALGYRFADKVRAATGAAPGDEGDELVRLARARGRAAAAGEEAGGLLLELLSSGDLRVRHEAGLLLRKLYRRDFGFAAYDPQERRDAAVGRWKNFVSGGAAGAEIEPTVLGTGARGVFQVLVGKKPGKEGAVLTWTTSGKKVGAHELSAAMGGIDPNRIAFDDASGMIIASGGGEEDGRIAIFSADGVELWNASGVPAGGGTAALPGGTLLVAIGDEVEELDVTGDRVGRWELGSEIASFGRLREGRYLCTHPEEGSVAEYGPGGELLWEADGLLRPSRVERLPNGNLLIVCSAEAGEGSEDNNSVVGVELLETTADGGEVLARVRPKGVTSISSAARLPNGNTLVGTEKGLAEYTPEGYAVKVWLKTPISSLHVR